MWILIQIVLGTQVCKNRKIHMKAQVSTKAVSAYSWLLRGQSTQKNWIMTKPNSCFLCFYFVSTCKTNRKTQKLFWEFFINWSMHLVLTTTATHIPNVLWMSSSTPQTLWATGLHLISVCHSPSGGFILGARTTNNILIWSTLQLIILKMKGGDMFHQLFSSVVQLSVRALSQFC